MNKKKKWFTCTPVNFVGNSTFFARDSGLLCKGFQEFGIECKAIMPGAEMDDDQKVDLIRTNYKNLENPSWWSSLDGEGVVFYGWGMGKYEKIARAIKGSGMILVTHIDSAGVMSVFNGIHVLSGSLWRRSMADYKHFFHGLSMYFLRMVYASTLGIVKNDWFRAKHLKHADVIGAVSPIALSRIKNLCRIYGGHSLADRVHLIPHPNASYMKYDDAKSKECLVIAVGRWDDEIVKGTSLLMDTWDLVLKNNTFASIEIYGKTTPSLDKWHSSMSDDSRRRTLLKGVVPNIDIRKAFQRAQISICTSLSEGYHTVSAEALCSGCSVVGPDTPDIPTMQWFAAGPFGRMSDRSPVGMATALMNELACWGAKQRNPVEISQYWTDLLHAQNIAKQILHIDSCNIGQ